MDYVWVRLAPYNPRVGNLVRRHGHRGTMYAGGERPTWYKVSPAIALELADKLQEHDNPRSARLFELYHSDNERARIDKAEMERRFVAQGLMAESSPEHLVRPTPALDLTQDPKGVPVPPARAAALPEAEEHYPVAEVVAVDDPQAVDLTTSSLAAPPVAAPAPVKAARKR